MGIVGTRKQAPIIIRADITSLLPKGTMNNYIVNSAPVPKQKIRNMRRYFLKSFNKIPLTIEDITPRKTTIIPKIEICATLKPSPPKITAIFIPNAVFTPI